MYMYEKCESESSLHTLTRALRVILMSVELYYASARSECSGSG